MKGRKIVLSNLYVDEIYEHILYVHPRDHCQVITGADIAEIYQALIDEFGHTRFVYITEFAGLTNITPEARNAVSDPKYNKQTIADALVLKSFSQRFLGTLYLKIDKPTHPVRLFSDFEKALTWVRTEIIPKIDRPGSKGISGI